MNAFLRFSKIATMRLLTLCTLLSSLVFAHAEQEAFEQAEQEPWRMFATEDGR